MEPIAAVGKRLEINRLHTKLGKLPAPTVRSTTTSTSSITGASISASTPDAVFRRQADLAVIYDTLTRTTVHTVKPYNIATFLGKKLSPQFEGESGNRYNIRIEGTRINNTMGPVSLKLYDKFSLILGIETTVNDLTFFKHYREVEHRDGTKETKWAPMQKTIYSLPALRELLEAANRRYWSSCPPSKIHAMGGTSSISSLSRLQSGPLLSRLQPL